MHDYVQNKSVLSSLNLQTYSVRTHIIFLNLKEGLNIAYKLTKAETKGLINCELLSKVKLFKLT